MDFKKLPFWGQFAVVAAMAIALVTVAWTTYPNFTDMAKKNAEAKVRLEGLQTEIRKGQAIEAKLPEFEKEIENLQLKLSDLLAILPTEPETGELLKWLKHLAAQSNLDVQHVNPRALQQAVIYKALPRAAYVDCAYRD